MTDTEYNRVKKAVDFERHRPARQLTRRIYMRQWRKEHSERYNQLQRESYNRRKAK